MNKELLLNQAEESIEFNKEEWFRCSISRSYYYLYHNAIEVTGGSVPRSGPNGEVISGGMHKKLYTYLQSFSQGIKSDIYPKELLMILGQALKTQHSRRVDADYKLELSIPKVKALHCLKEVKLIVEKLEACRAEG